MVCYKEKPDFSDYGNQVQFMKWICFSLQAKNHTFIFVAFASMQIIANNYYVSKYEIVFVLKSVREIGALFKQKLIICK